jgi:hypothetical protein
MPVIEQGANKKSPSFWCCGACSFLAVAFGVFFVLLGIWATHLQQRFTPIYSEVVCHMKPIKLDKFVPGDNLHLDLVSTTVCENPNPYSVQMKSSKTERVYMGQDRTLVASITDIPPTTLPAHGSGTILAKFRITPTGDMIGSLFSGILGALTGKEIPIYFENRMELVVDISFLIGSFSTKRPVDKDCGLNLKVGLGESEIGPMVCGDSFDQLQIPPADHPMNGDIRISAVRMAKDDIEKGKEAKDVGLGAAMGIGYGLGFLLLLAGSCGLWRTCRRRHEVAGGGASAREIGDLAAAKGSNSTNEVAPAELGAPTRPPEEV